MSTFKCSPVHVTTLMLSISGSIRREIEVRQDLLVVDELSQTLDGEAQW